MRRLLAFLSLSFLILWMSGCATMGSYSVSESELEGYLREAVSRFDQQQMQSGSPLSVSLKAVDIDVGPDNRDVVVLDVDGQVSLNAFMTKLPVDVALKVEGAPYYSSKDKAVYIRRLNLLSSNINSPYFKGDLKPVTDNLMRALAQMLETMPVYRLDESDFRQRMLGSVAMDVKVSKGRLTFVPAE